MAPHTGPEPERSRAPPPTSTGERSHTAPVGSEALPSPTMGARATADPVWSTPAAELDSMGDTHNGEAEETRDPRATSCANSGVRHSECHCEHVSFLIGKYPKIGKDVILERLDRPTDQWYECDETAAGILDDQTKLEKDVAVLRVEEAQYHENVRPAFHKQQQVIDGLLQLVHDISGRLKGLEDRAERSSFTLGPELPATPAAAKLVERVMTLGGAMEEVKPMEGPVESAPYAPLRVDPRGFPFVPMFSELTMLGKRAPLAGSMREEHVVVDLRSPTRETSAAARDPQISTAHAVYAEEEIHTMEARAKGGADRHGHRRGYSSGNLWVKDAATGLWTAGGSTSFKIPTSWGSGGTGPLPMEERDVRGVYSDPRGTGGIRLRGVVSSDVGDALGIDDLRGIKIFYYDGIPSNLDDCILDWEDFAEGVVGEMSQGPRDKWACRTFPPRLAWDLKEELRDRIREGAIRTEQACLQRPEDEEHVYVLNQKLEDLWSIPLPLERGELRVPDWNRYIRKYRRCLREVDDWNEASEIRQLLKDILPSHWKK